MASMEDLIATISGGMHVGKQANELKDLQATLSDTLHGTIPTYRAVPAPVNNPTNHIPPAPASSWNSPPPASFLNSGAFAATRQKAYPSTSPNKASTSAPTEKQQQQQQQDKKTAATPIQHQDQNQVRPYYAGFLPEASSPPSSDGFANDAFKPLWSRENHSPNGSSSTGAFTKSR